MKGLMNQASRLRGLLSIILLCLSFNIGAQTQKEAEAALNLLLKQLQADKVAEQALHREREQQFIREKDKQQARLAALQKAEREAEALYTTLNAKVKANSEAVSALQAQIQARTHHLKDLYSVAKQVSQDAKSDISASLTASQYPNAVSALDSLMDKSKLPEINDLQALWLVLLQDIQATGEVVTYTAPVYGSNGEKMEKKVSRVGPFTATTDNAYLGYSPQDQRLNVLMRQPELAPALIDKNHRDKIDRIIDPTRGTVFTQLNREPTLEERVEQGGYVGVVIISLGVLGLIYTLIRLIHLSLVQSQVKRQLKNPAQIDQKNPLGRVLAVHQQAIPDNNAEKDSFEGLEIKLNEAIMREAPRLDKGTGLIKLLATVAPLLGLLGTVTGMIGTFQAITLYGAGDPKLMAGGISQALMTTVLGLIVAIPLLFGHNLVVNRVKALVVILSQQSLALVAAAIDQEGTDKKGSVER